MNKKRILCLICLVLALTIYQNARAAIDLISFTARQYSGFVLIEWETAAEFDIAGFIIARSTNPSLPYEEVSNFIPAEGSGVIGAKYQFVDQEVDTDVLYYYVLKAIATDQSEEQFGPLLITIHFNNVYIPLMIHP